MPVQRSHLPVQNVCELEMWPVCAKSDGIMPFLIIVAVCLAILRILTPLHIRSVWERILSLLSFKLVAYVFFGLLEGGAEKVYFNIFPNKFRCFICRTNKSRPHIYFIWDFCHEKCPGVPWFLETFIDTKTWPKFLRIIEIPLEIKEEAIFCYVLC